MGGGWTGSRSRPMVGFETSGSATIQLISLAEFDYIFHIQLLQIIQPVETGPARIGME
jgi:hypothetical protein